ncbi:DVU0150 family protein [Desulfobaculum sp. SPO524]|uniref:DVU0150 family protein n=1 Tax=Desulfobaculum sp. SPO524 TaxID=3378071 RepID=UPI0038545306
MKKRTFGIFATAVAIHSFLAKAAIAGGGAANDLVVVADTRVISSDILRYFADLYNTNILLFAIWAVVLTAAMGCILGFIMDRVMQHTGIDLSSRKIVEH